MLTIQQIEIVLGATAVLCLFAAAKLFSLDDVHETGAIVAVLLLAILGAGAGGIAILMLLADWIISG